MESLALMPKYEDYVESGVEWLGDIPASWSLLANKHIFRLKKKQVGKRSNEYDLLSLTLRGVIKRDMENPEGKFPAEFDTYQEVQCGDFIFCLFDVEETPRTVGLSPFNGMITGAYTVFEPNDNFDNRFLYYFYLNLDAKKRLKPLYRGLRNTIPKDSFLSFKTFVPPHEQQTLIANFLDKKTAQIDEAIAIKEQQINLLKERKQIIIQQAVTQGLDPNVPMKDSGVDWIGKIPAHWEVKRLKYVTKILKRIIGYEGPDVLSITQKGIKVKDIESGEGQLAMDYSKYQIVRVGDFAMNHMDLLTGYVDISQFEGVVSPDYRVFINTYNGLRDDFLLSIFQLGYQQKIFYRYGQGVSLLGRWRFPADNFNNFFIPVPPIEEQAEIVQGVQCEWLKLDNAIELLISQIEKLKEYKTSLINSAVTGKIKITPEMVEQ
ncbi:restriction endonuclease subunit S [Shewanella indica]|uniref:restriction endonuclease subunit S n=1 Tax=Shewanella indica TaxID=768528 RepID=UPI0030071B55